MLSRLFIALGLLVMCHLTLASDVEKPVTPHLPQTGLSVRAFVPKGWKLEQVTHGDLNGDGKTDIAFVLRQKDPLKILKNDQGPGVSVYDTNPRTLVVAFFVTSQVGYRLAVQHPTLLPGLLDPTIDDPFDRIKIKRGVLYVHTHFWANAGSWEASSNRLAFRHDNECFRLIGFDDKSLRRNTGGRQDLSINLLTGSSSLVSWNEFDRTVPRSRLDKVVNSKHKICIDDIEDATTFKPPSPFNF